MSKVFITKNGQFLSRGEGVLTQIENPDLEVNDIGVEVSEKIAEDVKEGDVLYKELHIGENNKQTIYGYASVASTFYKKDGDLYCVLHYRESGPQLIILKYQDGKWLQETVDSDVTLARSLNRKVSSIVTSSNEVLISRQTRPVDDVYGYQVGKLTGNTFKPFPSSITPALNTNSVNSAFQCNRIAELNGVVHGVVGYTHKDTSGVGYNTFIVDYENEELIDTSINDNEVSAYRYRITDAAFAEYNTSSFMFLYNNDYRIVVYGFDNSTSSWNYLSHGASMNTSFTQMHSLVHNGDVYVFTYGQYSGWSLFKFDPSTFTLTQLTYAIGNQTSITGTMYNATCYTDPSGGLKVAMCNTTRTTSEPDTPCYGVVYDIDLDTSTNQITSLIGEGEFYRSIIDQDFEMVDSIEHDGVIHLVGNTGYYGERVIFFKSDETGNNFKRNLFWESIPGFGNRTMSYYDRSGITHVFTGQTTYLNSSFQRYITSGDPSGYLVPWDKVDVTVGLVGYHSIFYEDASNNLYLMYSTGGGVYAYRYQDEDEIYYKIADSDLSTIELTSNIQKLNTFDFSGTKFLTTAHTGNSPSFKSYILDGSSWSAIDNPSSLQVPSRPSQYYTNNNLVEFNSELFWIIPSHQSQTSSTLGFYTYKWDGSEWVDVSSSYSLYDRFKDEVYTAKCRCIIPFIESGSLFLTAYHDDSVVKVYEYLDGSGWYDRTDLYPPNHDTQVREGWSLSDSRGTYIISQSVGSTTKIVRRSNGKWKSIGVLHSNNSYGDLFLGKVNGEILIHTHSVNIHPGSRFKLNEFTGQEVWTKTNPEKYSPDGEPFHVNLLATGIALQDGSKGDIIKIRRIKR